MKGFLPDPRNGRLASGRVSRIGAGAQPLQSYCVRPVAAGPPIDAVKDAAVYDLMGRDYYMQGDYKRSTESLERAAGRRTSRSPCMRSGWAAPTGAAPKAPACSPRPASPSKARQYFERAVELDPRNLDALSRPVRLLPGSARLPGRRHGEGAARGGTNRRTQPGRGLPGEGQAGREATRIFHRRGPLAIGHRSRAGTDRQVDRVGALSGAARPRAGGRPEPGSRREDRARQPQADVSPKPICTSRPAASGRPAKSCSAI